jgi:hypothetical protein
MHATLQHHVTPGGPRRDFHHGLLGYRATAISADGRATRAEGGPKTDAILVYLEAESGEALMVAMPYRVTQSGGYEYAPTFAARRSAEVFA